MTNKTNFILLKTLALATAPVLLATNASAIDPYAGEGTPILGAPVITTGGDVTATFIFGSGSYSDYLYVQVVGPYSNPGGGAGVTGNWIFDNHLSTPGQTVDLGTFAAGTELIFHVVADTTGANYAKGTSGFKDAGSVLDWYTGPAARNADGFVHAWVDSSYTGPYGGTAVGFEDLSGAASGTSINNGILGPGDAGYEDLIYSFTSVTAGSVPDASSTLPLLGTSLAALLAFARRLKK